MKILFLTSSDHPQVKYEAEALSKLFDLNYKIIKFNRSDLPCALSKFFRNLPNILIALMKLRIPPIPFVTFLNYLLVSSFLIEEVEEKKHHLIYAHWLYPAGYVGLILSKIMNCKVISVIWGYDIQVISGIENYGIRRLNRVISKTVLEKSDLVIVNHKVHKIVAKHLLGLLSHSKIVYVPPAIPDISVNVPDSLTDELKEKIRSNNICMGNLILYSPSLGPQYGIWEFAKAAPIVANHMNDCIFIVVGEGELKEEVMKFIRNNNLEDKVVFLGRISHESMKTLFKCSTLVCDLAYPGTGTTTLEAFCFGKPVIGIRSPKTLITHGVNGFLIKKGDHQTLAEYIMSILSDKDLKEQLSKSARKTYEENFRMEERILSISKLFKYTLYGDHDG
jgi:glycosyltransferase involved in cell wall biosynthesis